MSDSGTPVRTKEEEEKENIKVTVQLANDIYKVMQDERMKKITPDDRHKILLQKYKNFADMYPVVLRFLARDVRYNANAFERMLEKLLKDQKLKSEEDSRTDPKKRKKKDPLSAMKAFITHQADYAKFLYLEECKRTGRHYDSRKANAIWSVEYDNMHRALKKIKDDEDKARNEFEEEKKKHLDERRRELLDFIREGVEEVDGVDGVDGVEAGTEEVDGADGATDERTEEEKEVDKEKEELQELESYVKDLGEAYTSFQRDDGAVLPGIENEDLEEYAYVLEYCKRIFDLAVKHDKMSVEDRNVHEHEIAYCLGAIEKEFLRRREFVIKQKEENDKEWIEGLIPLRSAKGSGRGSGRGSGKGKKR